MRRSIVEEFQVYASWDHNGFFNIVILYKLPAIPIGYRDDNIEAPQRALLEGAHFPILITPDSSMKWICGDVTVAAKYFGFHIMCEHDRRAVE